VKTLRLILGDQLNTQHSWFQTVDPDVAYLMMEIRQETDYVRHHIQKIMGFFAAMREFAQSLRNLGHTVIYLKLDDIKNTQKLDQNVLNAIRDHRSTRFEYLLPDELRLDRQLKALCNKLEIPTTGEDTQHFLTTRHELEGFFEGKKTYLMESFYRQMRRKHGILMQGDEPAGGKWNYDQENRKKLPASHRPPAPLVFANNVVAISRMIDKADVKSIGAIDPESFVWPISREQSLTLLEHFVTHCLPRFGTYQDAMTSDSWSLYHSRISFSLNTKMLSPAEVVQRAIGQWKRDPNKITLAQIEGFVRQIIGWREFMRGIYWTKMPAFAESNFFDHQAKLPDYFWTGETKMACVSHAVRQSLEHAYAHHIQRLMITGNFALLSGIDPDELDQWYLGIYIDAIEWVEITNTRGMSQFADGGIVGTKPYVSSANYIHKMSHYCKGCHYDHKLKTGERSCPFNSLYWQFYDRHRDKLGSNPRIGMAYRNWQKMDAANKQAILSRAEQVIRELETL
jgi:deoxyribodipyrimidine photolyase-related protein